MAYRGYIVSCHCLFVFLPLDSECAVAMHVLIAVNYLCDMVSESGVHEIIIVFLA